MATVTKPIALDESFHTTEQTPRNIADVLAEELSHITGRTASEVEYDNTDSGLTADNVQDALDEIAESVPTLPSVDIQTAVDEFETYNGGLLSECKVTLEPVQDLHGYAEPWVGGAGKNKANPDNLEVGYYSTTGYNNSPNFKTTEPIAVENGQTYSGSLFNSNDLTERYNAILTTFSSGDTTNAIRQVVGESITIQSGESFIRIRNNSDQTPLIQSGDFCYQLEKSASATAYEPYENICPISGHTEAKVGDVGKNWANPIQGNCTPDGTISLDPIRLCNSDYIPVKVGQSFTVSVVSLTQKTVQVYFRIFSEKGTQNVRQSGSWTDAPLTISIESGEHFLQLVFRNSDNSNITPSDANIQLELGSTATSYEPYNGYQVTVNLGGTYYSGTLDVVTGVLTVDKAGRVFDGTENWEASDTGYFLHTPLSDAKASALAISNLYKYSATTWTSGCFGISSGKNLWVGDTNLLSVISADNLSVVYELATPQTIQLSPTMVKALVGENHLSAPLEGQEITESKYKQMFTFDDVIAYIQSIS